MKLVAVIKHCTVRYDRAARKHRITRGLSVLVWRADLERYVRSHACVVEVGCPACGSRKGLPCRGKDGYVGWTHYQRRRRATKERRRK